MMNRLATIIIYCTVAALIVGCASSSPTRFYTLSTAAAPAAATPASYSVSVGPVSVPAVVDRPQIVVRSDANQIFMEEFDRWASPLKGDIARVVAENLVSMLGTPQVSVFPQSTAAGASYRVSIDVLHFDSEPGKAATLDALWTVSSAKDKQSQSGRTTVAEPTKGNSFASLVEAHSRALGRLSADIVAAIREIDAQKK
ncbi:MAG TPA: PqiC family protein [Geobacteraceae bacterium]|nr:PqiC family protein [Geobacteraceae bacterium]